MGYMSLDPRNECQQKSRVVKGKEKVCRGESYPEKNEQIISQLGSVAIVYLYFLMFVLIFYFSV